MNLSWKLLFLAAAIVAVAQAGGGGRGGRRPKPKPCRWTDAQGVQQSSACSPSQYFQCEDLSEPKTTRDGSIFQAVCLPRTCTDNSQCSNGEVCQSGRPTPSEDDISEFQKCFPDKPLHRGGSGGQTGAFRGQTGASGGQTGASGFQGRGFGRPRGDRRHRRQTGQEDAPASRCSIPVQAMLAHKACNVNGQPNGQCKDDAPCNTTSACTVNLGGQNLQLYFCNCPQRGNNSPQNGGNQPDGDNNQQPEPFRQGQQGNQQGQQGNQQGQQGNQQGQQGNQPDQQGRRPKPKPCRWTDAQGVQQSSACSPSQYFQCEDLSEPKTTRDGSIFQAVCLPRTCTDNSQCSNGEVCQSGRPTPSEDDISEFQKCFPDKPLHRGGSGGQTGAFRGQTGASGGQTQTGASGFQGRGFGRPRGDRRHRRQTGQEDAPASRCSIPVQAMLAHKACNVNGQPNGQCKDDAPCNTTSACTVNLGGQNLQLYFCNRPQRGNNSPQNGGNQPDGDNNQQPEPFRQGQQGNQQGQQGNQQGQQGNQQGQQGNQQGQQGNQQGQQRPNQRPRSGNNRPTRG